MIQRHDIGDSTQRNQVQQVGEVGLIHAACGEPAFIAQTRAQGQHDIEGHADTGEILTREWITR